MISGGLSPKFGGGSMAGLGPSAFSPSYAGSRSSAAVNIAALPSIAVAPSASQNTIPTGQNLVSSYYKTQPTVPPVTPPNESPAPNYIGGFIIGVSQIS